MKLTQWFRTNIITVTGVLLGAIGGYLYYVHIGCSGGNCMITSRPLNSTIYGAIMGGLFFNLFRKSN